MVRITHSPKSEFVAASGESVSIIFPVHLRRILRLLFTANVIALTGTWFVHFVLRQKFVSIVESPWAAYLLSHLNLASENTIVTWYSSILLLFTSLLALLIFISDRRNGKYIHGWLFISTLFAALSLDETGSLHENADILERLHFLRDGAPILILLGALLAAMAYMIVFVFRHVRWNTPAFWMMCVGACLFISIPLQEKLEYEMWKHYGELWTRPVALVVLEEGAELMGALAFFAGLMFYINRKPELYSDRKMVIRIRPASLMIWLVTSMGVCAGLYIALWHAGNFLSADDGIAVNWFPAVMAVATCVAYVVANEKRNPFVICFSFVLSVYFGANFYANIYWDEVEVMMWIIRGSMTLGLIAFIYLIAEPTNDWRYRSAYLFGGLLISCALLIDTREATALALTGLCVLFTALIISCSKQDATVV